VNKTFPHAKELQTWQRCETNFVTNVKVVRISSSENYAQTWIIK